MVQAPDFLTAAESKFLKLYARTDDWPERIKAYRECGCTGAGEDEPRVRRRVQRLVKREDAQGVVNRERERSAIVQDEAARGVDEAQWQAKKAKLRLQQVMAETLIDVIPVLGKRVKAGDASGSALGKLADSGVKLAATLESDGPPDFSQIMVDLRRLGVDPAKMAESGETLDSALQKPAKPAAEAIILPARLLTGPAVGNA